jgi:hypothetical protein
MSVLGPTLGALEVGVLCSSVLYGVATAQTFLYAQGRFKDPIWLQILVSTGISHANYLSIFWDLGWIRLVGMVASKRRLNIDSSPPQDPRDSTYRL